MEGIWKYKLKKLLENYLSEKNSFVRSVQKIDYGSDAKIFIKFIRNGKAANTLRRVNELPESVKEYLGYFEDNLSFVP